MRYSVGIDIAKEVHWVSVMNDLGEIVIDRSLRNEPEAAAELVAELRALGGERRVGIDIVGGIASVLSTTLLEAGECLVYVTGIAVNRARQGTRGGETKSDPRDARAIADLVRVRRDLRPLKLESEELASMRIFVGQRRALVADQTARLERIHNLLAAFHPELERALDLTRRGPLVLLSKLCTARELRKTGKARLTRTLEAEKVRNAEELAATAVDVSKRNRIHVPGEAAAAAVVRELAVDALVTRERIVRVEAQLSELLLESADAAIVMSMPGMGVVLTSEFFVEVGEIERFVSSDALAAAAGVAPVLRQSGKTAFRRRASGGNKVLKRVFYQSAFASLKDPRSRAYYARKRREGKRHHQAVLALARRRVDVLWAMLRDGTTYRVHDHSEVEVAA
jgi:transposase